MGEQIDERAFTPADHERFAARCREGLRALDLLLRRPGFGDGPASVGVEVEIGLVGPGAEPAPVNAEVAAAAGDDRLELELDRFNLEVNSPPAALAGRPFTALRGEVEDALGVIARAGRAHGARPVTIGILPSLRAEHLGLRAMTDAPRYRALNAGLRGLREGPFRIRIEGEEELLETTWDDVTLEGAATGMHVHLRAAPADFAARFNAAQMAVAPALAAAANSPVLLGRVLWEETRVALFGQAVDDRAPLWARWLPSRASFGHGWIARPLDPFAESVALHVPILPVVGEEDPLAVAAAGGVPELSELRLHHGTVWRWTRATVALGGEPHLRVEMRALPAGPTPIDMAANAAFLTGLALALAPEADWMARALPFELARRNFYAAARSGLDAVILWPAERAPSPRPRTAADLVADLLPPAREALVAAGVDAGEARGLLDVVATRAASRRTGAAWQRRALAAAERDRDRAGALRAMTEAYAERSATGAPVHEWDVPERL